MLRMVAAAAMMVVVGVVVAGALPVVVDPTSVTPTWPVNFTVAADESLDGVHKASVTLWVVGGYATRVQTILADNFNMTDLLLCFEAGSNGVAYSIVGDHCAGRVIPADDCVIPTNYFPYIFGSAVVTDVIFVKNTTLNNEAVSEYTVALEDKGYQYDLTYYATKAEQLPVEISGRVGDTPVVETFDMNPTTPNLDVYDVPSFCDHKADPGVFDPARWDRVARLRNAAAVLNPILPTMTKAGGDRLH